MKYIVGIPYRNRIDLLRDAINSIKCYWDNLVLIDNSGCQELSTQGFGKDFLIIESIVPLTLTQSHNTFIQIANEKACDFFMFMHNDAVADKGIPENFLELVQQLFDEKRNWGALFTNEVAGSHPDLLAAYNMEAINNVGLYDTVLHDYFSDWDYYRRMIIKGYELIDSGLNLIHQNGGSNTINSDRMMNLLHHITFLLYRGYYIRKWGGEPGKDQYTIPFSTHNNIMGVLTLVKQKYGSTATLEQVIKSLPEANLNIIGILTLIKQEYGPTATVEQIIESHPDTHQKALEAVKKYYAVLRVEQGDYSGGVSS